MNAHTRNVYQLAENLGMTVTRLKSEMTLSEYFGWVTFYSGRDDGLDRQPKRVPSDGISMRGFNLG